MIFTGEMIASYHRDHINKDGKPITIKTVHSKIIDHPRKQTVEFRFYRLFHGSIDITLEQLETNLANMGLYARLLKTDLISYPINRWPFHQKYWMAEYRISDRPDEASEVI